MSFWSHLPELCNTAQHELDTAVREHLCREAPTAEDLAFLDELARASSPDRDSAPALAPSDSPDSTHIASSTGSGVRTEPGASYSARASGETAQPAAAPGRPCSPSAPKQGVLKRQRQHSLLRPGCNLLTSAVTQPVACAAFAASRAPPKAAAARAAFQHPPIDPALISLPHTYEPLPPAQRLLPPCEPATECSVPAADEFAADAFAADAGATAQMAAMDHALGAGLCGARYGDVHTTGSALFASRVDGGAGTAVQTSECTAEDIYGDGVRVQADRDAQRELEEVVRRRRAGRR